MSQAPSRIGLLERLSGCGGEGVEIEWAERFLQDHLVLQVEDDLDDLLFLVVLGGPETPARHGGDGRDIVVRRRLSAAGLGGACPPGRALSGLLHVSHLAISWEESYYLNLICQLEYRARLTVLARGAGGLAAALSACAGPLPVNRVRSQLMRRAFASPLEFGRSERARPTFPEISFWLAEEFAETAGFGSDDGMLCIEVSVVLGPDGLPERPGPQPFQTFKGPGLLPVFQGAVTFAQVVDAFAMGRLAKGLGASDAEVIRLRGPEGKGLARISAKDPTADHHTQPGVRLALHSLLRGRLARTPRLLAIQPVEVRLHWRSIAADLHRHLHP